MMMNIRHSSVLLLLLFFLSCQSQITLIDQNQSDFRIVLPVKASPIEEKAAYELNKYLEQISGLALPVVYDDQPATRHEIVVGQSIRLEQSGIRTGFREGEDEGFLLRTKDEKLFITGGSPQGTLNGIYSFLEKYLGCRYYSPKAKYIPKIRTITLPEIKAKEIPVFSYRELYFPGRNDPEYRAWHKLHSHHDGSWGMWVHTFDDLVPPKTYFSQHPEYFSEINGIRMQNGQLCLSNPEVFEILGANLRAKMNAEPEALYWSVSQNDNYLACQCAECRKIADEYGGESGIMIWFVNRVAELFPEKVISTLAYQYTRSAPKHIKPLPNVNIMLCSIECNRSRPIPDDPTSASFVEDVKDWTRLTKNILIWDYVVQFRNYISPFPNLRVLQPNLEFFAKHGCHLMFQQGSGQALSEFVDLRSYIIAKLLWDPELDTRGIMNDFIYGYYGGAAPYISDYIKMIHDELENTTGSLLWIYGFPYSGIESYLRPVLIPEYRKLFDQAEAAVKDDPEILDRVKFARLPLDFAILDISLHRVDDDLSWFTEETGEYVLKQDMVNLLDTFTDRCARLNVKMINEQGTTPEEYRAETDEFILKNKDRHMAVGKEVTVLTPFSPKYDVGGAKALTDGLRGTGDYHFNWLGFEGEDLEAVIDLGKDTTITEVRTDFLQDFRSWIFLPRNITVLFSSDGEHYTEAGKINNIVPVSKPAQVIQAFTITTENTRARYIKVRATSLKTCPKGHIGYGKKCWIFTDEIVVK